MIHLSLPLRPRVDVRCEYLLTPISIALEETGKKVLCLSDIKATDAVTQTAEYIENLSLKLGSFGRVIYDSDPDFIRGAPSIIDKTLSPYKKTMGVRSCECGSYEELENVRMFDLRRVVDNKCVYCGTELRQKVQEVLLSDIAWPSADGFVSNRKWAASDLAHFLARQTKTHKISKQKESTKLLCEEVEFGIRYQIIWSAMIVYLSKTESDNDVTLHYVQKVQDKAFFISALAKVMCPDINIHLKALPIVWLDGSTPISSCSPSQVKLLGKSLSTKRKELKVSLKSWRY